MALTLPDELSTVLHDLGDATGKPASKVVSDLLQEMLPQLQGMAKIARAGKAGNRAAANHALREMLGDSLAHAMAVAQPELFGKSKRGAK
jgi:hypothetical protein